MSKSNDEIDEIGIAFRESTDKLEDACASLSRELSKAYTWIELSESERDTFVPKPGMMLRLEVHGGFEEVLVGHVDAWMGYEGFPYTTNNPGPKILAYRIAVDVPEQAAVFRFVGGDEYREIAERSAVGAYDPSEPFG